MNIRLKISAKLRSVFHLFFFVLTFLFTFSSAKIQEWQAYKVTSPTTLTFKQKNIYMHFLDQMVFTVGVVFLFLFF